MQRRGRRPFRPAAAALSWRAHARGAARRAGVPLRARTLAAEASLAHKVDLRPGSAVARLRGAATRGLAAARRVQGGDLLRSLTPSGASAHIAEMTRERPPPPPPSRTN
jgi:hypothetical protein